MTQQLRVYTVLVEDCGSVPRTFTRCYTVPPNSRSRGIQWPFLDPADVYTHIHVSTHRHTHNLKGSNIFLKKQ